MLICTLGEHFRRCAHALRFAVGLHGTQKFHPIVKYKHYQISSGARASLACLGLRSPTRNSFSFRINIISFTYQRSTINRFFVDDRLIL